MYGLQVRDSQLLYLETQNFSSSWLTHNLGNDATAQDQCNFDGYANMRYAILVGSITSAGNAGM